MGALKGATQGRWVGRDGGNAVVSARHVARTSRARTPRRRTSARREGRVWILVVVKVGVRYSVVQSDGASRALRADRVWTLVFV